MKYTDLFNETHLINTMPTLAEVMKLDSSAPSPLVNRLSQKGRRRRARQKLSNCGRRVRK